MGQEGQGVLGGGKVSRYKRKNCSGHDAVTANFPPPIHGACERRIRGSKCLADPKRIFPVPRSRFPTN